MNQRKVVIGIISISLLLIVYFAARSFTKPAATQVQVNQGEGFSIRLPSADGKDCSIRFIWIEQLRMWFGETEITLRQFKNVLSTNWDMEDFKNWPLYSEDWPAMMVEDRDGAEKFCKVLNSRFNLSSGYSFRLPTVGEWETVASCGNINKYPFPWGTAWPPSPMADGKFPNLWGIDKLPKSVKVKEEPVYFGYYDSDHPIILSYTDGNPGPAPVYMSGKNGWGIYGLSGNISEWCYANLEKKKFVLKGGFFGSAYKDNLRVKRREIFPYRPNPFTGTEDTRGSYATGFRIVVAYD